MRYFEDYESASEEDKSYLNANEWQINLLRKNPSYLPWGCFEDYMAKDGDGWDSRVLLDSWEGFGPWKLNDYPENHLRSRSSC